ncbi:MAG: zf-HC2 domain-containing protein [Opitutaceae bacterium]|nr:zf-HC2 domain-containing protein [Opitutaceae bacterium]
MKDSEFIELLNLYLDHEISAADAARLEAEVQNNPARRRIYQDYCRMQKACKVLAEEFQSEPVSIPDPKVIDLEGAKRRARAGNFYTAGAVVAAAACVAIIFVGRSHEAASMANHNEVAPQVAQPGAVHPAVATPTPATRTIAHTVRVTPATEQPVSRGLVSNQLFLTGNAQMDALQRVAAEQAAAQFAWMEQVQLAPIQTRLTNPNQLRLDAHSTSLRTEPRTYNNGQQRVDANVEMTAFQFQR